MKHKLNSVLWQTKSILILGYGREGRSVYNFLKAQFPDAEFAIADRNESLDIQENRNLKLYLGEDYLQAIKSYELVIKSPGIKLPDLSEDELNKIIPPTDIFLCLFGSQTVGVTGTKGKSTTSSLIHFLLKESGKKSILVGNIGLPALDYADQIDENTIVVFELSAHQLEFVHYSPHISLLLNIFPEHLDYFDNFERYKQAKFNIFKYQKANDIALCAQQGLSCFYCKNPESPDIELERLADGAYCYADLQKMSLLKGRHNLNNIVAALRVLRNLGVDVKKVLEYLPKFTPLPHRLEFVGEYGGVKFYNDSIATIPEATIQAIETLSDIDVLILGGVDRGLDYVGLTKYLVESKVQYFFFLGKAGERMYELMKQNTGKTLIPAKDLDDIFRQLSHLPTIKACLLSPAASSYDQFKNFEHRGGYFKELARGFSKT